MILVILKREIKRLQKKEDHDPKTPPKKRGRKSKVEHVQWLKEKAIQEAYLSIFEREIEDQLDVFYNELHDQMPLDHK